MASLVFVVLLLAMVSASDGAWCVCRSDVSDSALQKTLDYACGAGADCTPIQQGGACYNPNTVRAHCSYAANSYYQKKGQSSQACDFSGTATLTSTDPGGNGCTYPASSSTNTSNNTPATNYPPGSTTTTTIPGSTTPTTTTPLTPPTTTGTGGVLGGLGPTGNSGNTISTDSSHAPNPPLMLGSPFVSFILSTLMIIIIIFKG